MCKNAHYLKKVHLKLIFGPWRDRMKKELWCKRANPKRSSLPSNGTQR